MGVASLVGTAYERGTAALSSSRLRNDRVIAAAERHEHIDTEDSAAVSRIKTLRPIISIGKSDKRMLLK